MDILFSSAFALLIIFLITQFLDSKHRKALQKLAVLGVLIGLLSIIYVLFIASSSTITAPTQILAENRSNENLKIYAITFAKDKTDTLSTKVFFDKELKPSKIAEFSVDRNNNGSLWIVAKNQSNTIKHISKFDDIKDQTLVKISGNESFDKSNAQTARELIFAKDINDQVLTFAIWSNLILMVLLIWGFYKLSKIKN